jgi:diacylglycerol kinase family enzyme
VLVLINSGAGAFLGRPEAARALGDRMVVALGRRGIGAEARLAQGEEIAEAARSASESGATALLVAGGDGTLATVAQSLCDHPAPDGPALAALPLGTANLLARDLGMPEDPDAAVEALAGGVIGRIDVGRVNDRIFLNNVVLGRFADLARQRERFRGVMTPLLWLRLLWRLARTALHRRPLRAVVATDHGVERVRAHAMIIADNAYAARPGLLVRRDSLGRGALALYVMRHRSLGQWLRFALSVLASRSWPRDADLTTREVRRVVVGVPRRVLRATVDGEVTLLPRRAAFRIEPGALRVWVPEASAPVLATVEGPARARLADAAPAP